MLLFLSSGFVFPQKYHTTSSKAIGYYISAREQYDFFYFENAEKLLKQSISVDKGFYEAYMLLGEMYFKTNHYPESARYYREAVRIDSLFFKPVFFSLASAEMKSGDYLRAAAHFRVYIEQKTGSEKNMSLANKNLKDCEYAINEMDHPVPFNPLSVGDSVNTQNDEYWPSITADGKTLMFTRQQVYGGNSGKGQEDFYISHLKNKIWSKAINPGSPLNTNQNEGAQSISSDGTYMYFTACERPDGIGRCDIYYSYFDGHSWSAGVNVGPPVNTGFWEAEPSVSSNGKMLFFATNRPGGKGGMDIWYSVHGKNGNWGEPKNAGNEINTSGDEMSPFIHFDGKTLYFSSNGRTGMGGFDIFFSRMKEDSTWTVPDNLGYPINTSSDEMGLIIDASGQEGYYSTIRDKKNGKDIYYFSLYDSIRPDPVSYFQGTVYDKVTMQLLKSDYELVDLKSGEILSSGSTNNEGSFLVCLPSGINYGLSVSKPGYLFYSDNFMLEGIHKVTEPYIKKVLLNPIRIGETMQLSNVFYEFDSWELRKESVTELERLNTLLKDNPLIIVEVAGYTDSIGSLAYNQTLSEKRAKSVVSYLTGKGIGADRLKYKGYGSAAPIGNNITNEGRRLNRRTEVRIIGKKQ
jgi:outer membrane protein OmpA-like peptidoglycan-associated protein